MKFCLSTFVHGIVRGCAHQGPDGPGGRVAGEGGQAGGGEPVHQEPSLPLGFFICILRIRNN